VPFCVFCGHSVFAAEPAYDLLIRGGKIVDGSGNPWYFGDVDYWITVIDGVGDSTTFNGPSNKRIVYTLCND